MNIKLNSERAKVLLLNPFSDNCFKTESEQVIQQLNRHIQCDTPLGLIYVYTYAKKELQDVDFVLIDAQAMLFENASLGMEENWKKLISIISDINPDVIGIGAYFYRASGLFHETCKRIKTILPDTTIVAGGNYPTDATKIVLTDKNIDYIIVSEGEVPFTAFLKSFFAGKNVHSIGGLCYKNNEGELVINKNSFISDLSKIPIPDRSQLPMHLYGTGRNALDRVYSNYRALSMTISRGCAFECTFCTARNFWGRRIRYRDTSSVLDEMQLLKEKYGASIILIDDDNFLLNKAKASDVMEGMINRKLGLKWICGGGANVKALNDDDFLDLSIRSGLCFLNLAIESSSDKTLRRIKKPLKVEESVSLVSKVRKKYPHMYVNSFFIVGFPFETKQEIIDTLEFSNELQLDWSSHYIFKPFPNTELYEYCIDNNLIDEFNYNYGENFKESNLNGPDWTSRWLFEINYEYNLKVNFLNNRNLKLGNYAQALKDFEYIIDIAPNHALAYRQASLAANGVGNSSKSYMYLQKEKEIMQKKNEFTMWYEKLSIN